MRCSQSCQRCHTWYIEAVAHEAGSARSANVVLLGMAAKYIEILSADALRSAVAKIFERKGEKVVEANLKAFDMGAEASK